MGYKNDDSCIKKAFDNERLFVLMTRDPSASRVVVEWIKENISFQTKEKLHEALDCAIEMATLQKHFWDMKVQKEMNEKFSKNDICPNCNGTGEIEVGTLYNSCKSTCEKCKGTGACQ